MYGQSPIRRGLAIGLGVGALAGALEACWVLSRIALSLSIGQAFTTAVVAVVLDSALGLGAGLGAGLVVRILLSKRTLVAQYAAVVGLASTMMALAFAVDPVRDLLRQGSAVVGLLGLLVPLAVGGLTALNAHFLYRREEVGVGVPWARVVAMVVALLVGMACTLGMIDRASPSGDPGRPNVVLVTIDTLRRDYLSAYGSSPVQTPVFDALAARGVLFDDAVTSFPETEPSHSALFTGLHPLQTGVLSNGHSLADHFDTLAERLGAAGYATGAFVSSFAVDSRTGLDQGFDVYDDDFFPGVRGLAEIMVPRQLIRLWMRWGDPLRVPFLLERRGPDTTDHALDWVDKNNDHPLFLWVHFFEPHAPYEPHGLPGFEDNGTPERPSIDHRWILAHEKDYTYTDDARAKLRRLYAEEVAASDRELGELLDGLATRTAGRPTWIVVTADHGELLGEHGVEFTHHGLWEEAVRVGLVVVPPVGGAAGVRVGQQVRLLDVAPALLRQLGLEPLGHEKQDLWALVGHPETASAVALLAGRTTASLDSGSLCGLRAEAHTAEGSEARVKLVADALTGASTLYDLSGDPGETIDASAMQPATGDALRDILQQSGCAEGRLEKAPSVDPAAVEGLRALGYVE